MKITRFSTLKSGFLFLSLILVGCNDSVVLDTENLKVGWTKSDGVWKLGSIDVNTGNAWQRLETTSGEHTLLFSEGEPGRDAHAIKLKSGVRFPEPNYIYQQKVMGEETSPVSMNTAGKAYHFYPGQVTKQDGSLLLSAETDVASVQAVWTINPKDPNEIQVTQKLIAKTRGYFSMASPAFVNIENRDIAWATVPGYFQGNELQPDSVLAFGYGQGIPTFPALYRERCISTPASIADTRSGLSCAVIIEPGYTRDPWKDSTNSHADWNVALSHMSRRAVLSPTTWYPVLGEKSSALEPGDTVTFKFRFRVIKGSWIDNLEYAANDVYRFAETLSLRTNQTSLTARLEAMHRYLLDPRTSMWNLEKFNGLTIGAQSYLGGVVGSSKDAMKNADYGAMWMLGRATGDVGITGNVLPYARNFKLVQQQDAPGFFNGAAIGQYYLRNSKKFVEEWGDFIEPVSLTYYTMLDIGNILLFEPGDNELKARLRAGAERLLEWQNNDGSWVVAYDRRTQEPLFTDIKDLRPTFYGLLVAYRILGDEKYLHAARRGADWLIENGVNKGHFIGVCGDARYAPDFATAQTSQVLLDLYDLTREMKYRDAAIKAGHIYKASVYTHPIPSRETRRVNGVQREAWEISQAGLSFEHGGTMGSAQSHGPIQLASHAGLFVRMFKITGDSLFLTMARAAAIGRNAFVDEKTQVASYYWNAMNRGAGPYPHHAWWQIGWITDYLMAEAELRSKGNIVFPRGFVTPKVGPHQSYGFAPGKVYGVGANLVMSTGQVSIENPNVEYILADAEDGRSTFVILLNDIGVAQSGVMTLAAGRSNRTMAGVHNLLTKKEFDRTDKCEFEIAPYGVGVFRIFYK